MLERCIVDCRFHTVFVDLKIHLIFTTAISEKPNFTISKANFKNNKKPPVWEVFLDVLKALI